MREVIIGIDLGGTNLRIGTVTDLNQIEHQKIINTNIIAGAEEPLSKFSTIIKEYIKEYSICNIKAISIGVPSSVASDNETVVCTTNIRNSRGEAVFQNINMVSCLKNIFQVPVFINNDTNNILRYDVFSNQLEEQPVVVGIYIGTGVGASVLINGKSLKGANGVALDIGHLPFYKGEDICSCGKKGCCECFASGWKLQKIREEYFKETEISRLFALHRNTGPLKEFVYSCSNICSIMTTIFNPSTLVIGGGVVEMEDFPREELERQVNENTGKDVISFGFEYKYSESFVGKGIIGAAIFARKMMRDQKS